MPRAAGGARPVASWVAVQLLTDSVESEPEGHWQDSDVSHGAGLLMDGIN